MGSEWVAVGIVVAVGAFFVGFPIGVGVGYAWRDRISRMRRLKFAQEHRRAEIDRELALLDNMRAERSDERRVGKPAEEVAAASPGLSTQVRAEATSIPHPTISPAVRKATGSNEPVPMRSDEGKRRKMPKKSKLRAVPSDVQEPGPDRISTGQ
jgi:hypothetical protein